MKVKRERAWRAYRNYVANNQGIAGVTTEEICTVNAYRDYLNSIPLPPISMVSLPQEIDPAIGFTPLMSFEKWVDSLPCDENGFVTLPEPTP